MSRRRKPNTAEVVDVKAELEALVKVIDKEHDLAMGALRTTLDHALNVGEALLKVRELLTGSSTDWRQWIADNFPKGRRQAYTYMRLANNRHLVEGTATNIAEAERLVHGLPTIDGDTPRPRVAPTKRQQAEKMRAESPPRPYKKIAKDLAVAPSTVHNWFEPAKQQREARIRAEESRRQREKAVKSALDKGGVLKDAYYGADQVRSMIEQAYGEATDPKTRTELSRGLALSREAFNAVVGALLAERAAER